MGDCSVIRVIPVLCEYLSKSIYKLHIISITYQGPTLWNLLPAHVQKIDNYFEFKKQVTKLLNPGSRNKSELI